MYGLLSSHYVAWSVFPTGSRGSSLLTPRRDSRRGAPCFRDFVGILYNLWDGRYTRFEFLNVYLSRMRAILVGYPNVDRQTFHDRFFLVMPRSSVVEFTAERDCCPERDYFCLLVL